MAAADLFRGRLPIPWSYGVTEDGRVFFINDDSETTTWLHPVTMTPVQSGFITVQDLPKGWERGVSPEGALYYINHHNLETTFRHPVTGESEVPDPTVERKHEADLANRQQASVSFQEITKQVPPSPQVSIRSQSSLASSVSPGRKKTPRKSSSSSKVTEKIAAKRTEEAPISMKGWLYKQDSSGLKQWKKRWFVLADFCLFYYKGSEEGQSLGSILLPSYNINPSSQKDGLFKKHAFKAEHQNMRTYYLAAETEENKKKWMNAMSLATILQRDPKVEKQFQLPEEEQLREEEEAGFTPINHPHLPGNMMQQNHTDVPSSRGSFSSEQFHGNYKPNTSNFNNKPASYDNRDGYPHKNTNWGSDQYYGPNYARQYNGYGHMDHNSNEYKPQREDIKGPMYERSRPRAKMENIKNNPRAMSLDRRQLEAKQQADGGSHTLSGPHEYHGSRAMSNNSNTWGGHHAPHQESQNSSSLDNQSQGYYPNTSRGSRDNFSQGTRQGSGSRQGTPSWGHDPQGQGSRPVSRQTLQGAPKQLNVSPNSFEPLRVQVTPDMQKDAAQNERLSSSSLDNSRVNMRKHESLDKLKDWQNEQIKKNSPRPSPADYAKRNLTPSFDGSPPSGHSAVSGSRHSPMVQETLHKQTSHDLHQQSHNSHQPNIFQYPDSKVSARNHHSHPTMNSNNHQRESAGQLPRKHHERPRDSYLRARENKGDVSRPGQGQGPGQGPGPGPDQANKLKHQISTVKEELDMPDEHVLKTQFQNLKRHYAMNGKVRLSLSAEDLLGKSHEELVLLLIELRRKQSRLKTAGDFYKRQLELGRENEKNYQKARRESRGRLHDRLEYDHDVYLDLKRQSEEVQNQLEVHKPLVNLVDNLVKMGSLYGGNNDMYASQYKQHLLHPDQLTPPRKLLEFSRKLQEDSLAKKNEQAIKLLTQDEANLEEKLKRLYELDRALQEQSFLVTSLQDDKVMLEKALSGVKKQYESWRHDLRESERLLQQQKTIERELSKIRQELADSSRNLEDTTTENSKVEHEVQLLRSKVMVNKGKSQSTPNLSHEDAMAKEKMEHDLIKVQEIMSGLNQKGQKLSEAMRTLRHSNSNLTENGERSPSYKETDLDYQLTRNIAINDDYLESDSQDTSLFDITDADDNTKRFFGILPRDRPRVKTMRDVKNRETERRSRKDSRGRSESEEPEIPEPVDNHGTFAARRSQSLPRKLDTVSGPVTSKEVITRKRPNMNKERRQSATERLFPANVVNGNSAAYPANNNANSTNTSSNNRPQRANNMFAPKPFHPHTNASPSSTAQPFVNAKPNDLDLKRSTPAIKRNSNRTGPRRGPRYLTISSSKPIELETPDKKKGASIQTAAGDLISKQWPYHNPNADLVPDYVQSPTKDDKFDQWTIDRELFLPEKVLIPERYVPEDEVLTAEEKLERARKADRIKKMLSSHSLQDFQTNPDLLLNPKDDVHKEFSKEKKEREHLLSLNQALAKEVTIRSKQVAESVRRHMERQQDITSHNATLEDDNDSDIDDRNTVHQKRESFYT